MDTIEPRVLDPMSAAGGSRPPGFTNCGTYLNLRSWRHLHDLRRCADTGRVGRPQDEVIRRSVLEVGCGVTPEARLDERLVEGCGRDTARARPDVDVVAFDRNATGGGRR